MKFDSLCKNKIFKGLSDTQKIKDDPYIKQLLSSVFTGMGGRYTRMRILCEIIENPINTLELSKKLKLDYKTVQHNLRVLEHHNLIVREGDGYGDVFFPTNLITSNLPTLYKIIVQVEQKLSKQEKRYID